MSVSERLRSHLGMARRLPRDTLQTIENVATDPQQGLHMPSPVIRLVGFGLMAISLMATGLRAETPSAADLANFEKDVLPILKANCFACHGSEKKLQGGLKLTSRDDILKGGESGPAVDLKKPEESLILMAINYDGIMMPPKGKLPKAQIDILTKWITSGLAWSEKAAELARKSHGAPVVDDEARNFWAFRSIVRQDAPPVKDANWVRTPIDAFVLAKLEANNARPARWRPKKRCYDDCFTL